MDIRTERRVGWMDLIMERRVGRLDLIARREGVTRLYDGLAFL